MSTLPLTILVLVVIQRLAEVWYANRNTKRLLANGAREYYHRHYPLFFLLHGAWLISLFIRVQSGVPVYIGWLAVFVILQIGRLWVIATLGSQWTTRIIRSPELPIIRTGLFRYIRHPNYLIVSLEIITLPFVFGAIDLAAIFGLLNVALLRWRIYRENMAIGFTSGRDSKSLPSVSSRLRSDPA